MSLRNIKKLNLRRLIVTLAVITGIIMLINSFYASYKAQERILIENRLQLNKAYASKVAAATSDYLQNAMQQLRYSSKELSKIIDIPHSLRAETHRLYEQTENFDSVVVINANGQVLATSPTNPELDGKVLGTPGVVEALARKAPTISEPYVSSTGNLIIALSQPIFSAAGDYMGYVGGSIYLRRNHILDRLLGDHHYSDSTYLYAIAQNRSLLYHPERNRVGTPVGDNPIIDAVLEGETGEMIAPNSQGSPCWPVTRRLRLRVGALSRNAPPTTLWPPGLTHDRSSQRHGPARSGYSGPGLVAVATDFPTADRTG
ncbi:cache domain-containing protein [Neopusillimonas aromaticivorans]|uniref:cache domain-containing protein n=1 Tax=Neopusillimonas aromaticivorans TaxID=2979868 RepID=UPI0025982256|nr:cache domain-containing protein [Neopusillimonas aromaticivorans]WJJ94122.1 cache domain-containing protein [Neopusillimonas aromaticivorans]